MLVKSTKFSSILICDVTTRYADLIRFRMKNFAGAQFSYLVYVLIRKRKWQWLGYTLRTSEDYPKISDEVTLGTRGEEEEYKCFLESGGELKRILHCPIKE